MAKDSPQPGVSGSLSEKPAEAPRTSITAIFVDAAGQRKSTARRCLVTDEQLTEMVLRIMRRELAEKQQQREPRD